jgi:ribonuclease VapC
MIVIDSSAVIAMMLGEAGAAALAARLAADTRRVMSVASYLEAGIVLAGRRKRDRGKAIEELDAFLLETGISLEAVDVTQGRLALRARIEYGRGMGHGGALNYGDAFSYALAKSADAPLLFTGNDFLATDLIPALPPAAEQSA